MAAAGSGDRGQHRRRLPAVQQILQLLLQRGGPVTPAFEHAIPVLRIFDLPKAREFYEGFLGFAWDWEHRFEPDLPAFVQVSRGDLVLFLSEHHGDGTPGAKLILRMTGIAAFRGALIAQAYRHARPAIEDRPWGWRDMEVADPFGNRLVFSERMEACD
nr:glyoxalase superfamily protein [Roseomonas rubea]